MYHSSIGAVTAGYPVGTLVNLSRAFFLPPSRQYSTTQFRLGDSGLWYAQGVPVVFTATSIDHLMQLGAKVYSIKQPHETVFDAVQDIEIPDFNQPDIEIPDLEWVTPEPVVLPPSAFEQPSGGLMKYLPWVGAAVVGFFVFKKFF